MSRTLRLVLCSLVLLGAAPVRDNTYQTGDTILPNENMANEDAIFTYLQAGVDTYAASSVTTAALQDSSVTSAKIADGTITTADLAFTLTSGNILPSGAIFFMLTGSCPGWTTDVTATYSGYFVKINATQGTLSGSTTHTHSAGSFTGTAHTHSVPYTGWSNADATAGGSSLSTGKAETERVTNANNTSGSGGGGAISGTSSSTDHTPLNVTMIACRVD